jgi:cysteinyl-tRNA synthetase
VGAGETLALSTLGPFQPLAAPETGLPPEVWKRAATYAPPSEAPSAAVLALMEQRQAARARKDWPAADAARAQLSAAGWELHDTADGPKLNRRP